MANIITSCRILCSIALLFFPAFSPCFYFLYLICEFSDMIDGTVAGILLFMLPLTVSFIEIKYSAIIVCTVATFAAIGESYFIRA